MKITKSICELCKEYANKTDCKEIPITLCLYELLQMEINNLATA